MLLTRLPVGGKGTGIRSLSITITKIAGILMLTVMLGNNAGLFGQASGKPGDTTYRNPLPVVFGDPYVLYVKGDKYYMYGTGGVTHGFAAYSSNDLVHWKSEGQVWFANNKNGWS